MKVIRGKVGIGGANHSEGWHGYYGLLNVGYKNTTELIAARVSLPEAMPIKVVLVLRQKTMNKVDWYRR